MRTLPGNRRSLAVAATLLGGVGTVVLTQPATTTPRVEVRAPGGFGEADTPPTGEWVVAYQVDATVRLPLLIASVPIASRDAVGVTTFSARDYTDDGRTGLRTYELFAASFPERARGLNRLGFLREALVVAQTGVTETAQFGVISADREESREEADRVIDRDEGVLPYAVIDSLIEARRADSRVLRLQLAGPWDSAEGLYRVVRPYWDQREPTYARELDNAGLYPAPLAFLGALQAHLQAVANAVEAGEDPRRRQRRQPYVHNGRVFRFELRSVDRDGDRTAEFARAGWLENPAMLRRLDYEVEDAEGDRVDRFRIWVELRPASPEEPFPPPHLPIAYEYEPAGYLKLRATRRADPAVATR